MITGELKVGKKYYLEAQRDQLNAEIAFVGLKHVVYIKGDLEYSGTIDFFTRSYTEVIEKKVIKLYGFLDDDTYIETSKLPNGAEQISYREIEVKGENK